MPDAHREEIRKLEALYAEHPEGRIFTHLAEAYRKSGELEQARAVLEEGIERHPEYSSAHVVLGRVLLDQGLDRDAEAEFQRVLELDAHNMVALRSLGDLARVDGRRDDALDYYHRLLDIEPADADVRELVEQVRSGGAAEPSDLGAPEEAGSDRAPVGMVDGSAFEDAAWSLSEEEPSTPEPESEPPVERLEGLETSEPVEVSEERGPESPWVPFGSSPEEEGSSDEPAFDTPQLEGSQFEGLPVEDAPTEQPEFEASQLEGSQFEGPPVEEAAAGQGTDDGSFADWIGEEPLVGREQEPAGGDDLAGEEEPGEPAAADQEAEAPPVDPFASALSRSADDGEDDLPFSGSPGVMTETIAQVYARQGLYGRAADVYRGLVRERPDDAGLRARLAEMEQLAALEGEPGGPGELRSGTEREDTWGEAAGEGEAGELIEGLEPSELDTHASDVAPIEGLEVDEVDPETNLRQEAGTGEPVGGTSELEVRDVPPPPEEEPWAAFEETEPEADPWSTGSAERDEPWAESAPAAESAGVAEEEPESAEDASVWTGGDWAEPEGETPYAWAEPSDEEDQDDSPPIQGYIHSLLGWDRSRPTDRGAADVDAEAAAGEAAPEPAEAETGGLAAEAGAPEVGEPEAGEPEAGAVEAGEAESGEPEGGAAVDEPAGSERSGSEPSGPSESAPSSGAGSEGEDGGDDDDDLEMFRSWLESLKQ